MRFALLEAKMAVLAVWRRLAFQPGTKTQLPLTIDPTSQLAWVNGGLWATVVTREL